MKKWIPVIILFLLSANIFAQSGGGKHEQGRGRLKAQRVAFITERVDLTPKEAEQFWPMYNQFENDKKIIHKRYKYSKQVADMTDQEMEKCMLDSFTKDQELLDLKKAYFQKFKKVLPIKKLTMLQVAEKEFRRNIVNKLKDNRRGGRNRSN